MLAAVTIASLVVAGGASLADSSVTREEMESFAQPRENPSESVKEFMSTDPGAISKEMSDQARSVVEDSRDPLEQGLKEHFDLDSPLQDIPDGDTTSNQDRIILYVSTSLPTEEIRDAISGIESIEGVSGRVVFQGILEGEKLGDFGKRAREIAQGLEVESTSIEIDPTVFQASDVENVPRIEYRSSDGEMVAAVDGLSNPLWLTRKIESGSRGELGTRGPLKPVKEPNLIEVMKERFLALDMEAEKERTIRTFWDRIDLPELPAAVNTQTKRIDPTIQVTQPIKTASNEVIHPAGTRLNPLDMRPFTRRLLIINPTREVEREWLKNRPESDLKDILMITDIDRDDGWDGYSELQSELGRNLFILPPDVRQRFKVTATPTQVTASDRRFVVSTYALEAKPGGEQSTETIGQ